MYKSLMFKTNPLAEELSRYKQKQLAQGKTPINKNKKSYDKTKDKISHQNKFHNIGNKIIPKYPHSILKKSLNQSPQSKKFHSPEQNKKINFKIHNHSLRNDNFVNRSTSPQLDEKIKLSKRYSLKQKTQNPSHFQFYQNQKDKFQINEYMQYSVSPSIERKQYKKNTLPNNQKNNDFHVSFSQTKKSQQAKTMTTQNQLKSTLYQSIDLGNIFEKIDSKIDLSKAIDINHRSNIQKDDLKGIKQNFSHEKNSKQVKMIEKLRNQLTTQTSKKPSQIMKQFNIKNLIEKKIQNQRYKQAPNTPQPQSLTSRDPFFPQPTEIDTLINSLNFNDRTQRTWIPSTRKKSSVIIIDDKGNIIEDDPISKLKKNHQSKMKMSQKISKLRQVMKNQQMSERK